MSQLDIITVQQITKAAGLELVGLTGVTALRQDAERLSHWQEHGFFGQMAYLGRSAKLLSSPEQIYPEGRSIAVFLVPYLSRVCQAAASRPGYGRLARYAWGRDYHLVLRAALEKVVAQVSAILTRQIGFKIFCDAVPLLERALAVKAGLGFIGKNTMLVNHKLGSFTFVAELLWDVSLDQIGGLEAASGEIAVLRSRSWCGSCERCITGCPAKALPQPYLLDARRCISYLTIEKRGELEPFEREIIGEWLFGCDLCQECCPYNSAAALKDIGELNPAFAAWHDQPGLLPLGELLQIRSNAQFRKRFSGTALLRAGRANLLRNAVCVAANTASVELTAQLEELVITDQAAVVRQHALWALVKLHKVCNTCGVKQIKNLLQKALADPDQNVSQEAQRLGESFA